MSPLVDAHNHLQDGRLRPHLAEIVPAMREAGVARCVVNGTCESDWPDVLELAARYPDVVQPSLGLHPWKIDSRSDRWATQLQAHIESGVSIFLGECGLDRWMKKPDLPAQEEVFLFHLSLATKHNLPLSIHCLQAWGALLDLLRANPRPERGFLLHSYGGSRELVPELVRLGAYFSFSGHFLHERKEKVRDAFRAVPPERLLAETDAPDMKPPPRLREIPLEDEDRAPLNHPANLVQIVSGLAQVLGSDDTDLRDLLAGNSQRFFGITLPV